MLCSIAMPPTTYIKSVVCCLILHTFSLSLSFFYRCLSQQPYKRECVVTINERFQALSFSKLEHVFRILPLRHSMAFVSNLSLNKWFTSPGTSRPDRALRNAQSCIVLCVLSYPSPIRIAFFRFVVRFFSFFFKPSYGTRHTHSRSHFLSI